MFTAFYLRVSRIDLTLDNQLVELKEAGYTPTVTFTDEGVSGKVSALARDGFAQMVATLARVDDPHKRVVVTKIDRLGRNARDVLHTVDFLEQSGVHVIVKALGQTDLTSPTGKLIMTVLAAVAEMERSLIVERTQAGLARARAQGKRLGRRYKINPRHHVSIRAELAAGASVHSLARRYGVQRTSIRYIRDK